MRTLRGHTRPVRSVAISSDGTRIVSGSLDRLVKIWNAETGAEVSLLDPKGRKREGGRERERERAERESERLRSSAPGGLM